MGRFYIELNLTAYASSMEEAETIATRVERIIRQGIGRDEVDDVMIADVEQDKSADE